MLQQQKMSFPFGWERGEVQELRALGILFRFLNFPLFRKQLIMRSTSNTFRKAVLLSLFFLFSLKSSAQGNLQFNQVRTYGGTITAGYCWTEQGTVYTVPNGKVWKIENFSSINNDGSFRLMINGVVYDDLVNSPIWLKETDTFAFVVSCNNGIGQSTTRNWFCSIIEFNIIP